MNLRDLKYLAAIADLKSFSLAAERCFVSQPTLSAQIKKLEESLGVVIFERTNRSLQATEAGEEIIAAARRILLEAELIRQIAGDAQDPLAGRLRLGAFPTLASYVFPSLVPRIQAELPKLKLFLIEEKTAVLIQQLHDGSCDAALLTLPVNDPALVAMKLFEDAFWLAVPAGHPLAGQQQIEMAALRELKLLLLDEGHCLRDQALEVCYQHGGLEAPDFRASSLETLRMMVKAGTGLTLMPGMAIQKEDAGIAYIPFAAPQPKRIIGLVWRKTTARGALLDRLSALLKEIAPGKPDGLAV